MFKLKNLQVGPDDHPEIEKIVSLIPNIMFRDQKEEITSPIDPAKFLPGEKNHTCKRSF